MADFSLTAIFGMDATGIKTEIKSLRRDLNNFVEDYAKLGIGLGIAAFAGLSKGAIELAGSLSDASANIGINVTSLQALEAQHARNGVSNEELTKALQKTKAAVISAADGDATAERALNALGLASAKLIALPLDKQYEAIAVAASKAKDQNQAFSAVSDLLGAKVGPKLMGSLKELGEVGLPGVTKSAQEAGQVMSETTIVALDKAGDAIDDFKRKATIWAGEILVNFRTEEGLKLLGLQLMAVLGRFGGGILDAITEAGAMIWAVFKGAFLGVTNYLQDGLVEVVKGVASLINKILPTNFQINVGNLDEFKSSGKGIADEITEAIARTSPSTFKKDFGDSWDAAIKAQQSVVNALNKVDFGKDVEKLKDAGTHVAKSIKTVVEEIPPAIKTVVTEAVQILQGYTMTVLKRGEFGRDMSDDALRETITRNRSTANRLRNQFQSPNERAYNEGEATRLDREAAQAQEQLNLRSSLKRDYSAGGLSAVYNSNKDLDPAYLDGLVKQFAQNTPIAERTASSLEVIARGLTERGIIPRSR